MTGCLRDQVRLVATLNDYVRAERAAEICPIPDQQAKADRLHAELTKIAFACGFAPGRGDRNVSIVDWCFAKVASIQRMFPNNLREAGL